MKQLVAQIIVFLILFLVVGFFVYVFAARRKARGAGKQALASLAREMGADEADSSTPGLHGTFGGRRCSLHQTQRPGADDQQLYVQIAIICHATATFQLHRSQPSMAGIEAPDLVRTEDREFDRQLVVRSSDPERARAALTPDLRRRLLEWARTGRIENIWSKDGQLFIDGGYGLNEDWEVELARELMQTGVEIADALEGR